MGTREKLDGRRVTLGTDLAELVRKTCNKRRGQERPSYADDCSGLLKPSFGSGYITDSVDVFDKTDDVTAVKMAKQRTRKRSAEASVPAARSRPRRGTGEGSGTQE